MTYLAYRKTSKHWWKQYPRQLGEEVMSMERRATSLRRLSLTDKTTVRAIDYAASVSCLAYRHSVSRRTAHRVWENGRYSPGTGSGICQMCVYLFCSMQLAARRYAGPVPAAVAACRSRPVRDGGPSVLGPATAASFGGGQASALQQQQHSAHRDAGASSPWRPSSWWPPDCDGRGGSGATCPGGELPPLLLPLLVPSPWQPLLGRRYISSSTSLTRLFGEIGWGSVASSLDVDDFLRQQRLFPISNNNSIDNNITLQANHSHTNISIFALVWLQHIFIMFPTYVIVRNILETHARLLRLDGSTRQTNRVMKMLTRIRWNHSVCFPSTLVDIYWT